MNRVSIVLSRMGAPFVTEANTRSSGPQDFTAVRLYDGVCASLSHDGQHVACFTPDNQLIEVPTRTGETKTLTHDQLNRVAAQWFSNDTRLAFVGSEQGHGQRVYFQDVGGGRARAITPEGASFYGKPSPDGKQFAVAMGVDYKTLIFPVDGGDPHPVRVAPFSRCRTLHHRSRSFGSSATDC